MLTQSSHSCWSCNYNFFLYLHLLFLLKLLCFILPLRTFTLYVPPACRKPRLPSYPMNTRLTRTSPASPRSAPPPKRSPLPLARSRPWPPRRLTRKHLSPRTRPISCMRTGRRPPRPSLLSQPPHPIRKMTHRLSADCTGDSVPPLAYALRQ